MAGGQIFCGEFVGEDKSGSAFSGVLEALPECVAADARDEFIASVINPLTEYLEENEDHVEFGPDIASRLVAPVDRLFERYGEELGHPEPFDAPQIDEVGGLDQMDAKWGQGIGWRYYCLSDLRAALRESIGSGEPIFIHFD
jgi:hypothetical protein